MINSLKTLLRGLRYWWTHGLFYFINGYKFHTKAYSQITKFGNSGVYLRGSMMGQVENDYYGYLEDMLQMGTQDFQLRN